MTLRFFLDDSGKNDPPVFVLGGTVFDLRSLDAFENDWTSVLATAPAIPYFKMKEANAGRGVFEGVSIVDRHAKIAQLGAVLRDHGVATLSVTVRHDEYREIYEGQMMRWMDRPYQMMFHLAITTGYKLRNELGIADRAEFVFDRQLEHEEALRKSFAVTKRDLVPEIAEFLAADPRHADDKEELGLQAADMIAWHVRRSWRDGPEGMAKASSAGPAIVALPSKHDVLNKNSLRFLAQIATNTVQRMKTVFPYEADRIAKSFDTMATVANFELMKDARPFRPIELISFPATGTGRFQLVSSCAALGKPHLHRRSGNRCLGEASAV